MPDAIKITLQETHQLTRLPCTVCGGLNERAYIMAMGEAEQGTIRVCMFCHKDGDIDAKLEKRAAHLEVAAQNLRALKGRMEMPSFKEWEVANRRADDEVARINGLTPLDAG